MSPPVQAEDMKGVVEVNRQIVETASGIAEAVKKEDMVSGSTPVQVVQPQTVRLDEPTYRDGIWRSTESPETCRVRATTGHEK